MNKKLLISSDSALLPTGYSNIAVQIANRLANDYGWEVVYVSGTYFGRVLQKNWSDGERTYPFKMYGRANHQYSIDVLPQILREEKPGIFLTLLDTFMLYPWYFDMDFAPARSVFYYPSDGGGGLPKGCAPILQRMSLPVAMAKFGQKQAKELYGINAAYIPHAIDHNHYKPWSQKEKDELRKRWGLTNKFVVGTVARNQGRKALDKTIKIFKGFANKHNDAILLLHCDPTDAAQVFDIKALVNEYQLDNKVLFTGTNYYAGFPYSRMPEVYNLMDVFILTTTGEGFGIPIIEAMACEVPVIATSYTTTHELVEQTGAGYGIKLAGSEIVDFFEVGPREYDWRLVDGTITGSWNVERGFCSVTHGIELLEKLYNDPADRLRCGKNGREAVLKEYTWEKVAATWDQVLTSLLRY